MAEDVLGAIKAEYGTWAFVVVLIGLGLYYLIIPPLNKIIEYRREKQIAADRKEEKYLSVLEKVSKSHDEALREVSQRNERNIDRLIVSVDAHREVINEMMRGEKKPER